MNDIPSSDRRLLLLGWDAADWQHIRPLLRAGEMPALTKLMERGVWGNLATLQPMVSPMLWTSIVTGTTAEAHGVHGFVEPDPEHGGARPWSSLSRRRKAVWNILNQTGRRSQVVGWWASHPAEPLQGAVVSNAFVNTRCVASGHWRVPAGCVHPPELAGVLAPLKMLPREVTQEHILPFIPRAAEIDQDTDNRLHSFARLLSDAVTIHALATELMASAPWDFMAVYWDAVDHFCHGFMPFHPPRLPHIAERDFAIYKDVVRGAYLFHDMMLERLLELAGPETTVILCSDHGFLSGPNRPLLDPNDPAGPTLWHRDMGILVMAGPGIAPRGQIHGASLLDITPTILTLYGLPCGKDMAGKPLMEALVERRLPDRIPTWESVAGEDGRHPPATTYYPSGHNSDATEADALTCQMAALGYIEDHGGDKEKAAEAASLEAGYNLAQVHLCHDRPGEAVPLLEHLLAVRPWESRYIHQLANALTRDGWHRHAAELLLRAYPESGEAPPPAVLLVLARAFMGQGLREDALRCLARAVRTLPAQPGLWVETGRLAGELDRPREAEHAFRRALAHDSTFAAAWQGLADLHLQRREYEAALEAALEAVSHIWQLPGAHYTAGLALTKLGRHAEARLAFERVTQMNPRKPHAWRYLAALPLEGENAALLREACRGQAQRLSREWALQQSGIRRRAREPRPLPDIPSPAERMARIELHRPRPRPVPALSGKTFTLVSGLPRSGTSMMMQMLAAGGLPARTDGERIADDDNPEGYLEWEAIKRITNEPHLFDEEGLDRLAIKCVTAHLPRLPPQHRYRVLFMARPVAEIARSQQRMIERRGTVGMPGSHKEIETALQRHCDETLALLRRHPRAFEVLIVDYPSLVANPALWIEKLAAFLGPELLPHPECMSAAVRPALHRQRERQNEK